MEVTWSKMCVVIVTSDIWRAARREDQQSILDRQLIPLGHQDQRLWEASSLQPRICQCVCDHFPRHVINEWMFQHILSSRWATDSSIVTYAGRSVTMPPTTWDVVSRWRRLRACVILGGISPICSSWLVQRPVSFAHLPHEGFLDFIRALLLLLSPSSSFSPTSFQSQWAPPGLNCKFSIAVGTAVPVLDRSGHFRTSTASSRAQWALLDPNCQFSITAGIAGPQLAALDLSGQLPVLDRSGHCWTSTARSRAQWALPDITCQKECQNIFQIECQNVCQI